MDPDGPHAARGGEFASIARWTEHLPTSGPAVLHGPGDDAAWIETPGPLAVSVDSLVEDVHFRRSWAPPRDIGWRAAQAALSDLAASRARPVGMLLALSAPALDDWTDEVVAGVGEAAEAAACPVLGGDTTGSTGPVTITVTVLGAAVGAPLLRSGAAPGDVVMLTGRLGVQAAATRRLLAGELVPWPRPRARLDVVDRLPTASAAIDISDGLLADAGHLARASGVDVVIHPDRVAAPRVELLAALTGGEDYELLVTAPSPIEGFLVVGRIESGAGSVRFADGSPLPGSPHGWDHGGSR